MSELVQFRWLVAADGYEWGEASNLFVKGHRDPQRYLLAPVGSHRALLYAPLDETGLFRDFAELEPTEESLGAFAGRYGLLGGDVEKLVARTGAKVAGPGESFSDWVENVYAMRRAVALLDAVRHSKRELRKLISWSPKRDAVIYKSGRRPRRGESGSYEEDLIASPMKESEAFSKLVPGDLEKPAWFYLQHTVNKRIKGKVSPRLLWDESFEELGLFQTPDSLLGAMWLQLANDIGGDKKWERCVQCSKWFELAPGIGRKGKRYCSDACRAAAYRARKSR